MKPTIIPLDESGGRIYRGEGGEPVFAGWLFDGEDADEPWYFGDLAAMGRDYLAIQELPETAA